MCVCTEGRRRNDGGGETTKEGRKCDEGRKERRATSAVLSSKMGWSSITVGLDFPKGDGCMRTTERKDESKKKGRKEGRKGRMEVMAYKHEGVKRKGNKRKRIKRKRIKRKGKTKSNGISYAYACVYMCIYTCTYEHLQEATDYPLPLVVDRAHHHPPSPSFLRQDVLALRLRLRLRCRQCHLRGRERWCFSFSSYDNHKKLPTQATSCRVVYMCLRCRLKNPRQTKNTRKTSPSPW